MQGLQPFRARQSGRQAARDVLGDVRPADIQTVDMDQGAAGKDRRGRRRGAHVDADAAQFLLVLLQGRHRRRQRGADDRLDLEMRLGYALDDIVEDVLVYGDDQ